jgi:hypothetical protein
MVAPSHFLWLELLSVRNRDQLDHNYIKLPADNDGGGRQPRGLRLPGLSFRNRRFGEWESSDRVINVALHCCNSGNTLSKFFEDALRRVQSRGRDTRGEYCRSLVPHRRFARVSEER